MIYVFFAHGFEEIEALTAVDVLRRAGREVAMVGVGSKTVTGAHGITVHCDIAEREISSRGLEMIVLPGGIPGTLNLEKSKAVQAAVDHAAANNLWLAAICAAPSILGHKGLLEGKTVTCAPGFKEQLGGATYTGKSLEVDGKLITADGAGSAMAFALQLAECLTTKDAADALGASMQWGRSPA
jgi:4-methyl-5(b-hydroxyethyl)-thiazole monophosphate biosynthesis